MKYALNYALGLWSAEMVRNAVTKGVLTEEDAAHILVGTEEEIA